MSIPPLPGPDELAEQLKTDPGALARLLCVDEERFLPDDESPDVNEAQLAQLVAGQLSPPEAEQVMAAVRCYRPWFRALVRELLRPRSRPA
jgi:hypothetical protein